MEKRFKVITLGCKVNSYESQVYRDQLGRLGYKEDEKDVDFCIVNSCSVTKDAFSTTKNKIRAELRNNPGAKFLITGCLTEDDLKELHDIKEDFIIVPNQDKEKAISCLIGEATLPFVLRNTEYKTRSFVKVQDGCDSFCSYCVVPFLRGRSRSRKIKEIILEIEELVSLGCKEVVLTAINLGDFKDGSKNLADLIFSLDEIESLVRFRLSSLNPDDLDAALMQAILNSTRLAPSLHLALQSGSNKVLKLMRRSYTKEEFLEKVDYLKGITFSTDIMVGFPGEEEEDFEETLDVVKKVKFSKVHIFPYSKRPKTAASRLTRRISSEVVQRRKNILFKWAEEYAFALRDSFIGKTADVLIEDKKEGDKYFSGYSEHMFRVFFKEQASRNEMVKAKLVENLRMGFLGEICR